MKVPSPGSLLPEYVTVKCRILIALWTTGYDKLPTRGLKFADSSAGAATRPQRSALPSPFPAGVIGSFGGRTRRGAGRLPR